jgi:hypothetical protein
MNSIFYHSFKAVWLPFAFLLIAFFYSGSVFAIDVDPGQDSTYCSGSVFKLGGDPTAKEGFPPYEYEWESSNDSLTMDDKTSANPMVAVPKDFGNVVVFTLKVTDSEGFECTEEVTITIVKLGEIEFSEPFLPLNGTITASLSDVPAGSTIIWSFEENEIQCDIHPQTGVITSGSESGKVKVKASVTNPSNSIDCEVTGELCVNNEPCCEVSSEREFGPVTVEFAGGTITTDEVTTDGYCVYKDIPAKVGIKLMNTQFQDSFELPDITIAWEEKTIDNEIHYRNVEITWSNETGIELTNQLGNRIDVFVIEASLMINAEGQLTGDLKFKVGLTEPVNLMGDMINLLQDISGTFTYTFMAATPFGGTFDLDGIENINIDLDKKDATTGVLTTIAKLEGASLNSEGKLTNANFVLVAEELPIFDIDFFKVEFLALNLVFDFDIFLMKIEKFKSGNVKFDVFDIENVNGKLNFNLTYQNNQFNGTGTLDSVSAFGMIISGSAGILLTDSLTITSISLNNISAQHQEFDQSINNVNMTVELGKLKSFSAASVTLKYNGGIEFIISDINYANDSLQLNAKVLVTSLLELNVIGFRVSTDGSVSIKEVNGNIEKPPIIADIKAVFNENSFEGEFNATLLNVLGGGAQIQIAAIIGTATDQLGGTFQYGRFDMGINISGPAGVVLGTTGLKITGLSGLFGYNWFIPPIGEGQTSIPVGGPQLGAITLGMGITIGDVANNFAVTLAAAVSWGVENITFMASAGLKVPPVSPHYVDAMVQFQFNLNTGELKGPFTGALKVPAGTGKAINLSGQLMFSVNGSNWRLSKSLAEEFAISGTIFDVVTVNVNSFIINGPMNTTQGTSPENISGNINVNMNYTMPSVNVKFPLGFDATNCVTAGSTSYAGTSYTTGFGFSCQLNASISGNANAQFNGSNITGQVDFNLNAGATISVAWPGWTCSTPGPVPTYSAMLNGQMIISLVNNQTTVTGEVNVSSGNYSANAEIEFTL